MTFTSNPENVNSGKRKSNTLDSLLKKAKCQWTPANLMELENGQSQKALNKYALGLDLATSIEDSSKDFPTWPNHSTNCSRKINPSFGLKPHNNHLTT